MADIIATVDDPTQSVITATTSDGGTTIITSTFLSNPAGAINSISAIENVDTTTLNNGAILVYKTNTNKWTSTTSLDGQNMEGGEF
jgi:hypothetical protein